MKTFSKSGVHFRLGVGLVGLLALGACALPRSGPTAAEILSGSVENGGSTHIILVDDAIAGMATLEENLGFSRAFLNAGNASVDRINAGDVLSITVWENVDNGLLAGPGQSATNLAAIQVDQLGNIFVPYAGVVRASGRTSDELRIQITEILSRQTPDPQVEVRRQAGDGATVSILGEVAAQGVYPMTAATRRLTAMLATAGGPTVGVGVAQVVVQRGQETGIIWLQDLYDDTSRDIKLRANDRIIVRQDRRYYTMMGATNSQTRVSFEDKDPSIIEALSLIGGLNSNISDPSGIFVFRMETPEIANAVLDTSEFTAPQRVAYVIDLTAEEGIFTAQNFKIRDQDTIYVTEAPFVRWGQILQAVSGSVSALNNISTIAEAL